MGRALPALNQLPCGLILLGLTFLLSQPFWGGTALLSKHHVLEIICVSFRPLKSTPTGLKAELCCWDGKHSSSYPEQCKEEGMIEAIGQVSMLSVRQGHRLMLARTHQPTAETNCILKGVHADLSAKACFLCNSSWGHSLLAYS